MSAVYVVSCGDRYYWVPVVGVFRDHGTAVAFALKQETNLGTWKPDASNNADQETWSDEGYGLLMVERWEVG